MLLFVPFLFFYFLHLYNVWNLRDNILLIFQRFQKFSVNAYGDFMVTSVPGVHESALWGVSKFALRALQAVRS